MAYDKNGVFQATDQQSLTFIESQAANIETRVREAILSKVMYPELVEIDSDMDASEDVTVTYFSQPGTGRMTPLANAAQDLPQVNVQWDSMSREAYWSGISYGFDDMAIERAQRLRLPLEDRTVKAAFDIAEREKERVVLFGDENYGWPGLLRNRDSDCRNIRSASSWNTGDTEAIFETIRNAYTKIVVDSNQVMKPDTLLLPAAARTYLHRPLMNSSGITSVSVLQYLKENNPYTDETGRPMMIKVINELSDAGPQASVTEDQFSTRQGSARYGHPMGVLYDSNVENLRFIVPQDLVFIGPQRTGFSQMWYGRMKLGGVQWFYPTSCCYITNILPDNPSA